MMVLVLLVRRAERGCGELRSLVEPAPLVGGGDGVGPGEVPAASAQGRERLEQRMWVSISKPRPTSKANASYLILALLSIIKPP